MAKSREEKNASYRKRWANNPTMRLRKLASNKKWMQDNKKYRKDYSHHRNLKKYGLSISDYDAIFHSQNGNCAICGANQSQFIKKLYVDHNHKTGKVRGILCVNCNMLIGHAMEDISILEKSISYLKHHGLHA